MEWSFLGRRAIKVGGSVRKTHPDNTPAEDALLPEKDLSLVCCPPGPVRHLQYNRRIVNALWEAIEGVVSFGFRMTEAESQIIDKGYSITDLA